MQRIICTTILILSAGLIGCANRDRDYDLAVVREILELAQEDKVEGNLRMHLNGQMEMGMKHGFYLGSPGTVVQADLSFRLKDVQPGSKPE